MTQSREHIETLIKKAAQAPDACQAQQFAQAALSAASAIITLINADRAKVQAA